MINVMANKDLMKQMQKNSRGFHHNADGSWGTDEHDGKIIGDIFRGIGEMVAIIIGAKKR